MPRVCYVPKKFSAEHQAVIAQANGICAEYASQNLTLTLRQVYYQFVARGLLANTQREYNRLGSILNDARLAGEMDWDYMIDRTRNRIERSHWDNPGTLLEQAAAGYHRDLWAGQGVRPIVFVEKDAAIGVVEGVCHDNDIPFFSCRGYTSSSELWAAAQRIRWDIENGDRVVILHIGDHDPSGLDMTRDIAARLERFVWKDWLLTWFPAGERRATIGAIKQHMRDSKGVQGEPLEVRRIALNLDQIERYAPPPNPAKTTDARFATYQAETGLDESWELDALDPNVLISLIQDNVDALRDDDKWTTALLAMEQERELVQKMSTNYQSVIRYLETLP